ncbi:hypothetical protein T484DRAFT_1893529 [Baffinella frigidus]|nr:hypothetical protein T484DRAFT_1893529 [Cryptophyta sp. CCMP2293]
MLVQAENGDGAVASDAGGQKAARGAAGGAMEVAACLSEEAAAHARASDPLQAIAALREAIKILEGKSDPSSAAQNDPRAEKERAAPIKESGDGKEGAKSAGEKATPKSVSPLPQGEKAASPAGKAPRPTAPTPRVASSPRGQGSGDEVPDAGSGDKVPEKGGVRAGSLNVGDEIPRLCKQGTHFVYNPDNTFKEGEAVVAVRSNGQRTLARVASIVNDEARGGAGHFEITVGPGLQKILPADKIASIVNDEARGGAGHFEITVGPGLQKILPADKVGKFNVEISEILRKSPGNGSNASSGKGSNDTPRNGSNDTPRNGSNDPLKKRPVNPL